MSSEGIMKGRGSLDRDTLIAAQVVAGFSAADAMPSPARLDQSDDLRVRLLSLDRVSASHTAARAVYGQLIADHVDVTPASETALAGQQGNVGFDQGVLHG